MRRALKILKKILFWTFFVSLFFVTTITVILHIYEDDIKRYAIDELNEYLETEMDVMNIELSIFHDFPYASLEFQQVFIADAFKKQESKDTLFYTDQMFLNFSLLDLWNKDYKVKRVSLSNGSLNLRTSSSGDVNYDIIKKTDTTSTKKRNFEFMLELLEINDLKVNYSNLSTSQFYKFDILEGLLTGDFSAAEYNLDSESELYIHQIRSNAFTMIKEKSGKLNLNMNINRNEKSYLFNTGALTIEEMPFNITGKVDSTQLDLQITGRNIQLDQLANSLVDESLDDAKKYEGTGEVSFSSRISGEFSKSIMPSVTADFSIDNGTLKEPVSKLQINEVKLIGHYQNEQEGRDELLSFSQLNFKMLKSYFKGTGEIKHFDQPLFASKMKGNLDLNAFQQFFRIENINQLGGNIDLNLDFAIRFLDPEFRKDRFEILHSNGTLHLANVIYNKSKEDITYEQINGDIIINGKDAAAKDVAFKTKKSDMILNGAMKNLIPFIEGKGNLGLIAAIESQNLDLNEFLGEKNDKSDGPPVMFELPGDLNLNLELNLNQIDWDNHQFKHISGKMLMTNRKVNINNLNVNTLGGNIWGNLILNNLLNSGNVIDGNLSFRGIDVKRLFAEWDNFDQESITDKHISGQASGSIDLLLFFNPYFSLIEEKLYALYDLEIRNGELNELETMKAITDYLRSNKALKVMLNKHIDSFEDKLMHLQFDNLQNKIEIKDRKINIPRMLIKSNALDVELFGWHDFDNNVEYHFSFRFRDLKTVPEYTEFGKIEDDGLGIVIYLTMTGNLDDPEFSIDKEERKNDLRMNIAEEKQNIKSILKTEFGLFKKDSTIQQIEKENKKQVEFIFYEEDEEEQTDTTVKEKNKGRVGKIFDKWKEEAEKDKNKIDYQQEK